MSFEEDILKFSSALVLPSRAKRGLFRDCLDGHTGGCIGKYLGGGGGERGHMISNRTVCGTYDFKPTVHGETKQLTGPLRCCGILFDRNSY